MSELIDYCYKLNVCAFGYNSTTHISGSKVSSSPIRRWISLFTGIVASSSSADKTCFSS